MNIIKYTYRLDESKMATNLIDQSNLSAFDSLALHHMDHPTAGIDEVTGWHMDDNGWDWIGYGYWIGFDGTIYECRGYKYLNAAVKGNNNHIISIGFQGNYSNNVQMPQAQFDSGVWLTRQLKTTLPNIRVIDGHKHWTDTTCPGEHFPLVDMIRGIEVKKNMFNDEDKISSWAKDAVTNVATKGIMKGDENGNFRPKDYPTREELAVVVNNILNNK